MTVCKTCGNRSERDSDFLEIEVNLEVGDSVFRLAKSLTTSFRIMHLWRAGSLPCSRPRNYPEITSPYIPTSTDYPAHRSSYSQCIDTPAENVIRIRMRAVKSSSENYPQSYTFPCSALSSISPRTNARRASTISRIPPFWI